MRNLKAIAAADPLLEVSGPKLNGNSSENDLLGLEDFKITSISTPNNPTMEQSNPFSKTSLDNDVFDTFDFNNATYE